MGTENENEAAAEKVSISLDQHVKGGALQTISTIVEGDKTTAVRFLIVHATGHDDHILTAELAIKTGEELVRAGKAAQEKNRVRVDVFGAEALKHLGPPGNGAGS